jgi:hypothetical protein
MSEKSHVANRFRSAFRKSGRAKTGSIGIAMGRRVPNLKIQRKLGKNASPHLHFVGKFWLISKLLIS